MIGLTKGNTRGSDYGSFGRIMLQHPSDSFAAPSINADLRGARMDKSAWRLGID